METTNIEVLAYKLKKYKEKTGQGAIVFLGAGASVSGNIPLAGQIVKKIQTDYQDSPIVKALPEDKKNDYYSLMKCLDPHDRKEMFKGFIEAAKINVTHIYLAQLMNAEYIDYILTVNFDNLTQRALALYNMFPATYDIAMSKGLTTATFNHPGIVFLHGQHHGFNLLNTDSEFKSVSTLITSSLQRICNRPWIVVGYAGSDPVFEYINNLGSFDNSLYWVCYKEEDPAKNVQEQMLNDAAKNAYAIKGYDSDTFFLKLKNALQLTEPDIIARPFTHLKELHGSLTDIDSGLRNLNSNFNDSDSKAYTLVKERLETTQRWIHDAIMGFEDGKGFKGTVADTQTQIQADKAKLEIINKIIEGGYKDIEAMELKYGTEDPVINEKLSWGYGMKGDDLFNEGLTKTGDEARHLYEDAIAKYKKSIELNPKNDDTLTGWGAALHMLGTLADTHKELWYTEAIDKYKAALEINPKVGAALNNWGLSLYDLSQLDKTQAVPMMQEALQKHEAAINALPTFHRIYSDWANAYFFLAEISTDAEAEQYYRQAIDKYKLSADHEVNVSFCYDRIGVSYTRIAKMKQNDEKNMLLAESLMYLQQAVSMGESAYNLACAYALNGDATEAFDNIEKVLALGQYTFDNIETDDDWSGLRTHPRYIALKDKYAVKG